MRKPSEVALKLLRPEEALESVLRLREVAQAIMPVGSEIILDWDKCYIPVQFQDPLRVTVDYHWFNGVTRVILQDGTKLNLATEHYPHLWRIVAAPKGNANES